MKLNKDKLLLALSIILLLGALGINENDKILYSNNKNILKLNLLEDLYITKTPKTENTSDNNINYNKININTATKDELTTLKGIGDTIAERIIEYRKNKNFETIEELKNIKGIGEKKFEEISDKIKIDEEV